MEHKEIIKTCSKIADKVLAYLIEWDMATREKWQIMLDFENVNKICPLNFELLLNDDETLLHDYAGICMHFNRQTLRLDDYFVPRSKL